MNIGSHVLYDGKEYVVIHVYNSGYCEIRDVTHQFTVKLVNSHDIKPISL
jgi:hypothetical protein